nr:hypothetical protein HmN_000449800 [Hymenolepis microstoma]
MADTHSTPSTSVDLDATLPLEEQVTAKKVYKSKMLTYREHFKKHLISTYKRLNFIKKEMRRLIRLHTDMPEIDMAYMKKSEPLMTKAEDKSTTIVAACWNFAYPPSTRTREHCARIVYDSLGQPDQISMRRTNSGYEICEVQWHLKDKNDILECFQNWDLIGRIEITLPLYIDIAENEGIHYEDTYQASFRIIDRHYEIRSALASPGNARKLLSTDPLMASIVREPAYVLSVSFVKPMEDSIRIRFTITSEYSREVWRGISKCDRV